MRADYCILLLGSTESSLRLNGSQLREYCQCFLLQRRAPQDQPNQKTRQTMRQQATDSPSAPPPSPAPSLSVGVVLSAGESSGNGIQDNEAKDVRPQSIEKHKGQCTDEQVDHPVFVRVKLKHEDVVVSPPTHSCSLRLRKPEEQVRGRGCGSMAAVVLTGQPFFVRSQVISPFGLALDVDEDVAAHEVLDLRGQTFFVIQQRRVVQVASAS